MWKVLKKVLKVLKKLVKKEPIDTKKINNIDFEIADKINECSLADKLNIYYIQSIQNISESIEGTNKDLNKKSIFSGSVV